LLKRTASAKVNFCASGIFVPEGFPFLVLTSFFFSTAIPEASVEALKAELAALQGTALSFRLTCFFFLSPTATLLTLSFRALGEKEQLIRQHREALDAQETYASGLKEQLIQLGLKHSDAMKAAQAAAEAKLNEALEDANNSNAVLHAELEEGAKARKAAEGEAARLKAEQQEYDLLVMQTDSVALRKFFFFFAGFSYKLIFSGIKYLSLFCVLQTSFRILRPMLKRR
jgi:ABC-type multidrug transport system fused ATPase/permease subunit